MRCNTIKNHSQNIITYNEDYMSNRNNLLLKIL